jgi:hypothetical protein
MAGYAPPPPPAASFGFDESSDGTHGDANEATATLARRLLT